VQGTFGGSAARHANHFVCSDRHHALELQGRVLTGIVCRIA
jgi:hypothetical protein